MHRAIDRCRVCGNADLEPALDLGTQALTGVFPKTRDENVPGMPLQLVRCVTGGDLDKCGLLQLRHSAAPEAMYGAEYGYRSGLNRSMVTHLQGKVETIRARMPLAPGDLVIDIGSNDGTTLAAYPKDGADLVGVDPGGAAFARYYPPHVRLVPDFFSARVLDAAIGPRKAKVITSFSMFYDLEDPRAFMAEVADRLDDAGIWVLEQSYMPTMLAMNAYDTVCHEHLEYYGMSQIRWMMERAGLVILDVEFNAVNGGSFSIVAAKRGEPDLDARGRIAGVLQRETDLGLDTPAPYAAFAERVARHRDELRAYLRGARAEGRRVLGYGASTKGNVLLQYCGVGAEDLACIAEVNTDKFGRFTPGTRIPIVSEDEARALKPDLFLVLPWHFRDNILERERAWLAGGGRLLFPLPRLEVVGAA
ncbi:MAG TPA: class I SAM-dependent methyltransferase [Candidatus Polarisedimenticolia bacterium]|nr:class I SAM-dependent methyltransferase [Candidatus Polarisedimenticolia bacterium]